MLIAMAIHDTDENNRSILTERTINCLYTTVDVSKHRVFLIDNGSCTKTKELLYNVSRMDGFKVITLPENIGTAAAINIAWRQRVTGESCVKMDNDVLIWDQGWVEQLQEALDRDPRIGQIGLKRKDCWESTTHENPEWRSNLYQLPHKPGQRWIVVEKAKHIIGTCVAHSYGLLNDVGYLYQPGLYGYDDVLMSWRSQLAGFYNCFLPHIEIDHIDPGGDEYTDWKTRHSGQYSKLVSDIVDEYIAGTKSLYYE